MIMLLRPEIYRVTMLCKPDSEAIEKAKERMKNTVRKILYENQEFIGHVLVGYMGHEKRRDIEVGEEKISVCRLVWKIKGEKDILESFFNAWKKVDENPLYCLRAELVMSCCCRKERNYSLCEIEKLMNLCEKEEKPE